MFDPDAPDFGNTPVHERRPCFGYVPADRCAPPCVSVITPFYNTGPVFRETARSLMRQSLQQWEWIIVNDGSTAPQAHALLDEYRRKDPRIRVVDHRENRGLSAARNTGYREARTEFVFQFDSDDLIEATALEKFFWFLISHPEAGMVTGYTVAFGETPRTWPEGFHAGARFLKQNCATPLSMVRKEAFIRTGGYDEENRDGLEDWEFWLRCAAAGLWGGTVREYLVWYRRRPGHRERWGNWGDPRRYAEFKTRLRRRYARLFEGGFPEVGPPEDDPHATPIWNAPVENRADLECAR